MAAEYSVLVEAPPLCGETDEDVVQIRVRGPFFFFGLFPDPFRKTKTRRALGESGSAVMYVIEGPTVRLRRGRKSASLLGL